MNRELQVPQELLAESARQRRQSGVDYQVLFGEIPDAELHDDQADTALIGLQEAYPDAYRMVIYSWA